MDKSIIRLIGEIEHIIGSEFYNPNSYDGWNDIEGCTFRYPINVPDKDGKYAKIRTNINTTALLDQNEITENSVSNMKYKLGSNQLYIGRGIIKTLRYLEDRYNIDFNEMEKQIKSKQ